MTNTGHYVKNLNIVPLLFSFMSGLCNCNGEDVEKHILLYHPHLSEAKLHKISDIHTSFQTNKNGHENYSEEGTSNGKYKDFNVIQYSKMTFSHAESPVWDPESKILYWVDVLGQTVHALNYNTFKHRYRRIAYGEVNVVIPVEGSRALLVGCANKVFLLRWGRRELALVATLESGHPLNVLNEGKADARGRLWAGTKGPQKGDDVERRQAGLYKVEGPCYEPRQRLRHVTVSNGMTWALNNSVMYYIDSVTSKVEAFDFDLEKGHLSNRRTVFHTAEWGFADPSVPDGMTIDRDGMLWVALFLYGTILRVDPDRRALVREYPLPVSRTTSLTWAGPRMEDLVITTSRRNVGPRQLDRRPLSGTIFVLRALGTGGVPDHKVRLRNSTCLRIKRILDGERYT